MASSQEAVYSCQGCEYQDTEDMVQCDTCSSWYHYSCAFPDITDDIGNYSWDCRRCIINQFALTLVNDRQTTLMPKMIEKPVQATTSVIQKIPLDSQSLALDYMEAKRLLDEEQLNRSFEIQRKFLRERFHILKLNNDEKHSPNEMNDQITSFVQKDNVTSRVHFDDVAQQVPLTTSTPYRAPSTNEEQTSVRQTCQQDYQMSSNLCIGTSVDENREKKFIFPTNEVYHNQDSSTLPPNAKCQGQRSFGSTIPTIFQDNSAPRINPTPSNLSQVYQTSPVFDNSSNVPQVSVRRVLPKDLIRFGGSSREWPQFIDNYEDTTQRDGYSNADNLIRLQRCLYGSAYDIVRDLLTSPDNVPVIIETLRKMYGTITLSTNQIAARHVLPRDLPKFTGTHKEWPMFISCYESSTQTGGYSDAENLIRLQRCLQGKALESVRSILLTPANVPNVIETLRMMYGRPDLIIHSLIQQIREEQSPRIERLETIINFALAVRNLCSIIHSTRLESHMNNPYLIQEILDKLPSSMRLEWSRYKRTLPVVTMVHLGDWLYDVALAASDVVTPNVPKDKSKNGNNNKKDDPKPKQDRFYVASHKTDESTPSPKNTSTTTVPQKCRICQQNCSKVANCKKFQDLSVDQRWNEIKNNKLCSTCLKVHRRFQCRDKKKCKETDCEAWHHIMLHKDPPKTSAVHYNTNFSHTVIYRIIPVKLYGPSTSVMTYAYLDGGSGITLLEQNLAETLGVKGDHVGLNLKWTAKIQRSEPNSMKVGLQISDVFDNEKYEMNNVRTVRSLELPVQTLSPDLIKHYSYLKDVPIQTYEKAVARILIGLENINLMVSLQTIEGKWQEPVATKTRLGWVLQGGPQFYRQKSVHCLPMSEQQDDSNLHQLVKDYFNIESLGVKVPEKIIESKQSERARQIMETSTIISNGRSVSGLLWKTDEVDFPDNKAMAVKRLVSLERRMSKDENLAKNMRQHLADYQVKNYTRKLSPTEIKTNNGRIWYLPIFPAFNPKKPEKFRIVWDAAAEVGVVSLNSNLLTGPDLMTPLPDILYRFRERAIAVDGDIKEMFHQVEICKEDQNAQRFLWRDGDENKEPEEYVMQRLTFGASCSPSISQFIKDRNAKRYEVQFPDAVNSIVNNHYVDNLIDCTHTIEEAVTLVENVKYIHQQAGFELCKFRSNSLEVLKRLGAETNEKEVNLSFSTDVERILGMFWQVSTDTFTFSLQFTKLNEELLQGNKRPTKREVLRTLMTIFDPLGLLSFFLIYAKMLLQEIWSSNVGWDDELTDVQFVKWTTWIEILPEIENLHIPRLYSIKISPNEPKSVELHVFVDASELAFATVAYLRIEDDEGVHCVLVGSKTRVAPLKPISIPRLELQAGVLGARYMNYLGKVHTLKINRRIIWTDSRVLLQWLHSETRKYRQFVAFRIGEILELTNIEDWRWVPSKDNVADDATQWNKRPIMSISNRWFTGPEFLKENNNWEMDWSTFQYEDDEEEIRYQASHQELIPPESPNPVRFSKWERLLRAQAYVIRVICNVKTIFKNPNGNPLTSNELKMAEFSLFRRAQFDGFGEEVVLINWNKNNTDKQPKCLDTTSSLLRCSPYMDENNLMRVHGRIDAMKNLTLDNRRPIILPKGHRITELVIEWYHRRFHHANHQTVINELHQRFYIPKIRVALKSVITKCQICKNLRAQPVVPSMADLPAARLNAWSRAFSSTGMDYFGPMLITVRRKTEKRWGVLFTCLTTRAIHIEIVDSLDSESCILALRDFMVLYGEASDIYSDNGTNFHGSENELRVEFEKMDPALMQVEFTTPRTTWHFNPPAAAHMGGSWERLIRSVKNSLYHILQDRRPTYKILKNVLRECQGIVNSRPLTFVAVTSEDSEALTPYHFLIGSSGGVSEACEIPDDEKYIRRNWITSQLLINQFWTRWVREYLPTITRRTKWFRDVKPIEVGDIVYVVDEKLKRCSWPKGRVSEVFIGNNDQARSAMVKVYVKGIMKEYHRPVSKLAVLDVLPPLVTPMSSEDQAISLPNPDPVSVQLTTSSAQAISLTNPDPAFVQLSSSLRQENDSSKDSNDVTGGENVGVPPY